MAEAHEAALVDAEYRRPQETCRLTLTDRHDGTWEGRFIVPAAHGHILNKLALALGSPKHRGAVEGAHLERLPSPQRLGTRSASSSSATPSTRSPTPPASPPGKPEASPAKPASCPPVLGGTSEILDLGRTRRLHNEAQRIVILRRDKTCRAEGCDWPAWMGHIHHPIPWSRGGHTDLSGMALCPHHHTRAHDPTYEMTTGKHGKVIFRRT